ncbi:hypothetical protein INR49_009199 [Caranx melampygus]|nr:hypothetical protein INR49_009199 [Caranx melampygus]
MYTLPSLISRRERRPSEICQPQLPQAIGAIFRRKLHLEQLRFLNMELVWYATVVSASVSASVSALVALSLPRRAVGGDCCGLLELPLPSEIDELMVGLLPLIGQPVQALVETVAAGGTGGLNVPVTVA